jgi:DNA-binding NarL/FixJ family response regulator
MNAIGARGVSTEVLVADSDPRVVAQVCAILHRMGIASAAMVSPAVDGGSGPALLVTDLDLGVPEGGIDLAVAMRRRWRMPVVFLVGRIQHSSLRHAALLNPAGIVTKPIDPRQLEATVVFALELTGSQAREADDPSPVLSALRPREREVVRLLLEHHRAPAIARRLGISPQTVRNHLKGAFKRTGTSSQQELLDWIRSSCRAADVA